MTSLLADAPAWALTEFDPLPELDPELDVVLVVQVDRAVNHCHAVQAAEAVGYFLRLGKHGPSRFAIPASVAEAA